MEFLLVLIIFIFGICIGSFLNVLADRWDSIGTVVNGRSQCDYCKKTLRWFELIPLISFLLQFGKCRRCHKKLSWQYPLVEVFTGIVFGSIGFALWSQPLLIIPALIIASSLIVILVADLKFFIIPDFALIAMGVGVVLQLYMQVSSVSWINALLSALGSFLFLFIIFVGTKGKGMGFGDVKFAILLGLSLGFPRIIVAYYIAFLTGAFVGIILILGQKKSVKSRLPFGPFLVLGYTGALLFYEQIRALLPFLFIN